MSDLHGVVDLLRVSLLITRLWAWCQSPHSPLTYAALAAASVVLWLGTRIARARRGYY